MAGDLVIYAVVHQPRRLKLPAQPIPSGAAPEDVERCLFDERLNEGYFRKVARTCYRPATEMFAALADEGLRLSLGFSFSVLRQAEAWDPELLDLFRRLVLHPNVEPVGVEPYHSFIMLLDLPRFVTRMRWAQERLAEVFGVRPRVTDTTELCMSHPIYLALDGAGFDGAFVVGRPWVLGWRDPSFLYHAGRRLKLLARHHPLSDDVGYRFSNRSWSGWPLLADTYADWLTRARGDLVVLGWDYETFGEHHAPQTGIFEFMRRLPSAVRERGGRFLTASEAIAAHGARAHELPLPALPSTWAGSGGLEFFLGNAAQQAVFQLMLQAYNMASLAGDERLVDLALWLSQSDHLHLIQWSGRSGPEAEVSAYFTPREWWRLGPERIVREIQQVYENFIHAIGGSPEAPRRRVAAQPAPLDPEVAALESRWRRRAADLSPRGAAATRGAGVGGRAASRTR